MERRFSAKELYAIRTFIPIRKVIEQLLMLFCKDVEGVFRFVCPKCHEMQTAINPRTNLSRCFRCKENFNTIELVMKIRKVAFVDAVKYLKSHFKLPLEAYGDASPVRVPAEPLL